MLLLGTDTTPAWQFVISPFSDKSNLIKLFYQNHSFLNKKFQDFQEIFQELAVKNAPHENSLRFKIDVFLTVTVILPKKSKDAKIIDCTRILVGGISSHLTNKIYRP